MFWFLNWADLVGYHFWASEHIFWCLRKVIFVLKCWSFSSSTTAHQSVWPSCRHPGWFELIIGCYAIAISTPFLLVVISFLANRPALSTRVLTWKNMWIFIVLSSSLKMRVYDSNLDKMADAPTHWRSTSLRAPAAYRRCDFESKVFEERSWTVTTLWR